MAEEVSEAPVVEEIVTRAGDTAEAPMGLGTQASDWKDAIPEGHKDSKVWDKYSGLGPVLKAFDESQKFLGESIRVPGEGADTDAWESIYNKLGRPTAPENYELNFPTADETIEWDPEGQAAIKDIAHSIGLNGKNAQILVDKYAQFMVRASEAVEAATRESLSALQQEFGPTWDRNVSQADRMLHQIGGDELLQSVTDSGIGSDPVFIKAMFRVANKFAQDGLIVGEAEGVISRSDARSKISEIRRDKEHPINSTDPKTRREAAKELEALYQLAQD